MKKKSIFSLILVVVLCVTLTASFAACKKSPEGPNTPVTPAKALNNDDEIYNKVFGDFKEAYLKAFETNNVDLRYALMAIAEGKLMETAAYVPTTSRGGNYAIGRLVPHTITNVLYGNDIDRYHQALVAEEIITNEDYDAMKALYAEIANDPNKTAKDYENAIKAQFFGEGKYTLKDSYTIGYTNRINNWDVLATSRQTDTAVLVNTYDGLAEYDILGRLQPALAESWEKSEDGLTYTFKLRKGVKWVNFQGDYLGADVKAEDFIAGFQHMMDVHEGPQELVKNKIKGVNEYLSGECGIDGVGIKQGANEYELVYTLEQPIAYFLTMLSYSPFAPMCKTFYESNGGKFGAEFDATATDYTYAKGLNSIAYCGPYVVSNYTQDNSVTFEANKSYWNKDNINVKQIKWKYDSGEEATKGYTDMKAGVIDATGLNEEAAKVAKTDNYFDKYVHTTETDSTAFGSFVNLNRKMFANFNDKTVAVSDKTEEQKERTKVAVQNEHFRRAVAMAFDRAAYNAQSVGDLLKYVRLTNSYTPGTFVTLGSDVTVDINGKATTFKKGTFYGAIVQAQIDADGVAIKVWDANTMASTGFDGWYNPAEAVKELDKAIAELGIEITAENPIVLDLPYPSSAPIPTKRANAYKQSVEKALGKKVIINLIDANDNEKLEAAGFGTSSGDQANYDIYDVSGWGPDYGDPQTYLDTMLEDGYMVRCFGIFGDSSSM